MTHRTQGRRARRAGGRLRAVAVGLVLAAIPPAAAVVRADCNRNGRPDGEDIALGESADCNGNDVPDECEGAPLPLAADVVSFDGAGTASLAFADLDGDGRVDVAAGFSPTVAARAVAVLLQRGEREVETVSIALAERPDAVETMDVDGDGLLDVFAVSSNALYRAGNLGGGSFAPAERTEMGHTPVALRRADFDGDGRDDLALLDAGADAVLTLRNDGRGGLEAPLSFPVGDGPRSMAVADLDGDGDADIAAASSTSRGVDVLYNDGAGGFADRRSVALSARPYRIASLDADGDGRLDLVVGASGALLVLEERDGSWIETVAIDLAPNFLAPSAIAPLDADDDGLLDVAVSFPSAGILVLLCGSREALARPPVPVASGAFVAMAAGHLDADGAPEIAVMTASSLSILWSGERRGRLELEQRVFGHPAQPHWASLDDFDGDGDLDVVVSDGGVSSVTIQLNDGLGSLRPVRLGASGGYINAVTSGDFNGDGRIDAAVTSWRNSLAIVFLANGAGWTNASYATGTGPFSIADADLDGDGDLDLVTANPGSNSISILLNRGNGVFTPSAPLTAGSQPQTIAIADIDGDRDLDIAIGNLGSAITILLNDGAGRFPERQVLPLAGMRAVTAADLDGDGDVDLAATLSSSRVVIFERAGGEFTQLPPVIMDRVPSWITSADLDLDGIQDLITSNTLRGPVFPPNGNEESAPGSISILRGKGELAFEAPSSTQVGFDPRTILAGDMNGDNVPDVVVINHDNMTVSVLANRARPAADAPYLTEICTEGEFQDLSVPSRGASRRRVLKWAAPARAGEGALPVLFQNVRLFPLHQEFLAANFPELFPALTRETYDALAQRRATRELWVGNLYLLKSRGRTLWGASIITGAFDDPEETPRPEEARAVLDALGAVFGLRDLVYYPETAVDRAAAAAWRDPGFEVFLDTIDSGVEFRAYTKGVAYGRVRILDARDFDAANESGLFGFQDILVLAEAPRDIEGVVAGVITAAEQTEASHVAVRTARRGTPNAFVAGAAAVFAGVEGRLIRIEVSEQGYSWREAGPVEAEAWWRDHRPRLTVEPQADRDYRALPEISDIDLDDGVPPEARVGGKAANFARLQEVFTGDLERYRETGFAIPLHYYFAFLDANTMPSAIDPERTVTYAEFLRELFADERFQSDSRHRFDVLAAFRDRVTSEGRVDPGVVRAVALRVATVFGRTSEAVRFRSSSNIEDALEFNGAGLYDSTSACAADDLDADDNGPSRCDVAELDERGVARALKRVWASLWNFRAYEERAYYGIRQDLAGMGVLVSKAFPDERANGVAFTANPSRPFDRRYTVSVQAGDASVVSPEPGTSVEKDLLEVIDGEVRAIVRAAPSSLLPAGERVLSDAELEALGSVLWHIEQRFAIDLGAHRRDDVLIDVEFKVDAAGAIAIKQARPFLASTTDEAAPEFVLEVEAGSEACTRFAEFRAPLDAWRLKSRLRLAGKSIPLPTTRSFFTGESLVDEIVFGQERRVAAAVGPSVYRVARSPIDDRSFSFRWEQDFDLGGGERLRLGLDGLELTAAAAGAGPTAAAFSARSLERFVTLQGRAGQSLIGYEPCALDHLRLWEIAVELVGGGRIRLLERHEPPEAVTDTGPARLVRAEIDIGGAALTVDDDWSLVYTAARHNLEVVHRVVLEPPVALDGVASLVRAIDVVAPEPIFGVAAAAHLLDESFAPIESVEVVSYARRSIDDATARFRRGDVDGDGSVNITDAVRLLDRLFRGGPAPRCLDAADANDDGAANLSDAVAILDHLFRGRGDLPPPAADCGEDPTPDGVECARGAACE